MSTPALSPASQARERVDVPDRVGGRMPAPVSEEKVALPAEHRRLEQSLVTEFFREKAAEWRARIFETYGVAVDFELEGAMRCDLYRGKRPSKNPALSGQPVREADFSMRVGDDLDPHGPEAAAIVETILGGEPAGLAHANGWGQPSKLAMFYAYFDVPPFDEPVELELCVQPRSETCEISEYWHRVFSAEEIEEQRAARDRAEAAGSETYADVKMRQNEEGKFRLLYLFSKGALPAPGCVKHLVPGWRSHRPDAPPSTLAPEWAAEAWVEAAGHAATGIP